MQASVILKLRLANWTEEGSPDNAQKCWGWASHKWTGIEAGPESIEGFIERASCKTSRILECSDEGEKQISYCCEARIRENCQWDTVEVQT